MPAKKLLILAVFLLLLSGLVLAGQTIIQKGSVITDVFNATSLFVERVSGHLLKGDIDASDNKVTNLAEPVNPQDAATKAYVDSLATSKGLACEGIKGANHKGENLGCNATVAFYNIRIKYFGCVNADGFCNICPDYESAKRFCQEEGYSDTAGFTQDGCGGLRVVCPRGVAWKNSKWEYSHIDPWSGTTGYCWTALSTQRGGYTSSSWIDVLFCK